MSAAEGPVFGLGQAPLELGVLLLQGMRRFGTSGSGQRFESTFVSQAAPLRKIGGVEAFAPEKGADLPGTVGESVGLTYDGQFIGRCCVFHAKPISDST